MTLDKVKMLEYCNEFSKNTLMETLNIEYIDAGEGFLVAKMPVNPSVHQPMGLLHGGASVALAESVGSALCDLRLRVQAHHDNPLKVRDLCREPSSLLC